MLCEGGRGGGTKRSIESGRGEGSREHEALRVVCSVTVTGGKAAHLFASGNVLARAVSTNDVAPSYLPSSEGALPGVCKSLFLWPCASRLFKVAEFWPFLARLTLLLLRYCRGGQLPKWEDEINGGSVLR